MGGRFTADPGKLDPYGDHVPSDFARQLERERDEARELARELRDAFERFYGFPNCSRARLLAQEALAKAKEVLP
jgi:predicted secreted Zn-dependent protease